MYRPRPISTLFAIAVISTGVLAVGTTAAENNWPQDASLPAWTNAASPLADAEAKQLLRHLLPLPKRVRLVGKLVLPASEVEPRPRSASTDVEQTALAELVELIKSKTGVEKLAGPLPILIGVCDAQGKIDGVAVPGADKLSGLKNDDQAYVIAPLATRGIAVAGLTERAVYHGVKTLQQLIEPGLSKGRLTLPLVAVLDWPDLNERGEWGGSAVRDIQYLADRKMNLIEAHATKTFDENGRGLIEIDTESQQKARLHAVKWVPVIGHLNGLARSGIYKRYPRAEGRGPNARHPSHEHLVVPCSSSPEFVQVMAEWLESLGAIRGVTDVNIWLTELRNMQCECDKCKGRTQFVLEAKACVKAWQIARKKYPNLRIRILLSQGTYAKNDEVLAALPEPEVGVTYYSGSTTYDSSRDPMIYPLLTDFAKKGRWLGCYPQLTASWRIVCPWSGPQFMKSRMTEFVDKGLSCFCGYATPDNRFYDFNVTAAAEWSWNAHGRSEREFAAAWATRRGMADPDRAADWAVMLGPVGWDVYGSRVPFSQFFGQAARLIKNRKRPSWVGEQGMFRHFPTIERMDEDLAVCQKALALAEQLGDPALIAETRTIEGYVRMIKSIFILSNAVAGKKKLDAAEAKVVQATFDELRAACKYTTDALGDWKNAVAPDCNAPRVADTVDVTRQTVTDIGKALLPLGIKDK